MYVKLGEKAGMFFDPTSRVKVLPGQVVEVTTPQQQSKKFQKALNGGHIVRVSEEDFKKADKEGKAVSAKALAKTESTANSTTSKPELSKEEMINKIMNEFDGYTKKELNKKSDEELAEILAAE